MRPEDTTKPPEVKPNPDDIRTVVAREFYGLFRHTQMTNWDDLSSTKQWAWYFDADKIVGDLLNLGFSITTPSGKPVDTLWGEAIIP